MFPLKWKSKSILLSILFWLQSQPVYGDFIGCVGTIYGTLFAQFQIGFEFGEVIVNIYESMGEGYEN